MLPTMVPGVSQLANSPIPLTLTYDSDTANVDAFVALGSPASAVHVIITINSGVYLYSASTSLYALDCAGFAAGSTFEIINDGLIVGRGGNGGTGSNTSGPGGDGGDGGPALRLGGATVISHSSSPGEVNGGGGGGGGGGGDSGISGEDVVSAHGGGGGGGRGRNSGSGGSSGGGTAGSAGSASAAGTGGAGEVEGGGVTGAAGGNGGDWGASGSDGSDAGVSGFRLGGDGGSGGKAIELNGHTLTSNSNTTNGAVS